MTLIRSLASIALAAFALPSVAAIGTNDPVPAATLLLPYFEVGTGASGTRTEFTVGNVAATERLAHVTVYTDLGVPTLNFDIRIPGNGSVNVDLTSLFTTGALPQTTAGGFGSCSALPPAPLNATLLSHIQASHSGQASTVLGGQCAGSNLGDGSFRGYVTVDQVVSCSTLTPGQAGYFGTVAGNENVLWGQYAITEPALSRAFGDTLVAIEASTTDPATDGTGNDYTFYARRGTNGADHRESTSVGFHGNYEKASPTSQFAGTQAIIWRDPIAPAPFACNTPGPRISGEQIASFDNAEEVELTRIAFTAPKATQRIDLGTAAGIPFTRGVINYKLTTTDPTFLVPQGNLNQAFVSHVYLVSGGDSAVTALTSQFNAGIPTGPFGVFVEFAACSDGIDNDADGNVDFPADPSCVSATGESESPACSDGLDNDTDGQTDFPNDPGCASAQGLIEDPECSDGADNDSDTFTDFPADPDCGSPADPNEFFVQQCRDGIDNDSDGTTDFPADLECSSPFDSLEGGGACSDGLDNDGDMLIDFPADPQCSSRTDNAEQTLQCSDGIDNDGDGQTDFPNDPGCFSADSNNEAPQCNDGLDNDGDGETDFPADLGCTAASSFDEGPQCNDGVDNDGDMLIDFPADPGCASPTATNERPQCNDTFDNDGDMLIDFPADPGCLSASDTNEQASECNDSVDNDSDGLTDFPISPFCVSANDPREAAACNDGVDNDADGAVDFPADQGCASITDNNEFAGTVLTQCADGLDNDGDGFFDWPADLGCQSAGDDIEFLPNEAQAAPQAVPALSLQQLALLALIVLGFGLFGLHHERRHG